MSDGFEAATLPSALRRNLRKASRHGLVFSVRTDLDAIDAFYRLHVLTRRKLGVPVQRRRFFRRLHGKIVERELGFIGLVTKDGDPVAAGVFLTYGPTLIYKFGASEPSSLSMRPNELLFANVLELAADRGHTRFDFGVSRLSDEGLRRFKLKWHSRELPVYHTFLRGAPSERASADRLGRVAGGLIRRSPTIVCRVSGRSSTATRPEAGTLQAHALGDRSDGRTHAQLVRIRREARILSPWLHNPFPA